MSGALTKVPLWLEVAGIVDENHVSGPHSVRWLDCSVLLHVMCSGASFLMCDTQDRSLK